MLFCRAMKQPLSRIGKQIQSESRAAVLHLFLLLICLLHICTARLEDTSSLRRFQLGLKSGAAATLQPVAVACQTMGQGPASQSYNPPTPPKKIKKQMHSSPQASNTSMTLSRHLHSNTENIFSASYRRRELRFFSCASSSSTRCVHGLATFQSTLFSFVVVFFLFYSTWQGKR